MKETTEKLEKILLTFCANALEKREYLQSPFGVDDNIVYTDGYIMVRIKGEAKPGRKEIVKIIKEGCMHLKFSKKFITELPKVKGLKTCLGCGGTGLAHFCIKCSGYGYDKDDTGCEVDHDCEHCNGIGIIVGGNDTCPRCLGCKYERKSVRAFNTLIDYKYLKKIFELPNSKIGKPTDKRSPVPFSFDGGGGCVMPMRY